MKFKLLTLALFMTPFLLKAQISMIKKDDGILIKERNEKVFFYQLQPKDQNGDYSRCNYIHPLWAPDGSVVTEDFPEDHLHHRGIFWTWHQVWIKGKRIGDPWEVKDFNQKVSKVELIPQSNGTATLEAEIEWSSPVWIKDGLNRPYIRENTSITIHPAEKNSRRIDFEIALLALEEGLSIGGSEDDKGYSGFSVRMICPEDIRFTGPNGEVKAIRTSVESPGFVNVSGTLLKNEKHGGVVMVDHPKNPEYPQRWILRERRSMQNAAYPGSKTVEISTTEPLNLRYSLIVYTGKLELEEIEQIMR